MIDAVGPNMKDTVGTQERDVRSLGSSATLHGVTLCEPGLRDRPNGERLGEHPKQLTHDMI